MDDGIAQDIQKELDGIRFALERRNELTEETNSLMRSLIPALEATAQELLELRRQFGIESAEK